MPIFAYLVTVLLGYLLGSLPTGFLAGKAKGVDIRTVGSKNMGATNVFRTLGKGLGIVVFLLDAFKGYAACALVAPGVFSAFSAEATMHPTGLAMRLQVLAGVSAVLGHNYTCWLGFKGGKGIATTAGVFLALAPLSMSIALGVWTVLLAATRYVSIASIAAAVALPTAVWLTQPSLFLSLVTTGLGLLAIYKHKANIQRLLAGTENRIHFKKEKPAA